MIDTCATPLLHNRFGRLKLKNTTLAFATNDTNTSHKHTCEIDSLNFANLLERSRERKNIACKACCKGSTKKAVSKQSRAVQKCELFRTEALEMQQRWTSLEASQKIGRQDVGDDTYPSVL